VERSSLASPLRAADCTASGRREWATERKPHPAQDVAAAAAWRDLRALQTAYQHTDEATVLAAVSEPRRLREAKPEKAAEGA
jgi:hypothetical protein